MRNYISQILNVLLEPLICRIVDRLRPILTTQAQRLTFIEHALAPDSLPTVIKNELQNLESLPATLMNLQPDLTIFGYCADDAATRLANGHAVPVETWLWGDGPIQLPSHSGALVFLDEYCFTRIMARLDSLFPVVTKTLFIATRFQRIREENLRMQLHQLGFSEVSLTYCDTVTRDVTEYSISHPSPVACEPLWLDQERPAGKPDSPVRWLVARRTPRYGQLPRAISGA